MKFKAEQYNALCLTNKAKKLSTFLILVNGIRFRMQLSKENLMLSDDE